MSMKMKEHTRSDEAAVVEVSSLAGVAPQSISYGLIDSDFGRMLIGSNSRGICRSEFVDAEKRPELFERSAAVNELTAAARRAFWFTPLQAYLQGRRDLPAMALDFEGTAFQLKVWAALQACALGNTLSYSQLAGSAGRHLAVRAAASACAANTLAVFIPCHRAIRQDGSLGGFRWGLARKRDLLALEKALLLQGPAG
jgi:AraC family transcriptional regulator of adaptative response/methylated-DNA-[protein]-cysteine methyltransferase